MNLRFNTNTGLAAHVKGTDTLGAVNLVTGKAHEVNLEFFRIQVHLAHGLRGVAVVKHAVPAAHFADCGNILNDADFVVDGHHGNERRVRTDGGFKLGKIEKAVFLNVHVGHFKTFGFKMAHGVKHSLVFGLDRNEVLALILVEVRNPLIARLSASVAPEVHTISRGSALM